MRIKKNINLGIINWSNAKFSELTYCIVNSKKNYKFDLGVKGLTQWKDRSEHSPHKWYAEVY